MLKKVISITNLGRFVNPAALGSYVLTKSNIVYGENGKGKSTLTALLRSVGESKPEYLLSRQTLGQSQTPTVKLLFEQNGTTNMANFNGATWDSSPQRILVFDQELLMRIYSLAAMSNTVIRNRCMRYLSVDKRVRL